MDKLERINQIVELLKSCESMPVNDLCERFSVSEVTMRKDLNYLSSKGLIIKSYGTARIYKNLLKELVYNDKISKYLLEKDLIAKKASEFINHGDIIYLSTGTTIAQLCKYIVDKSNLTVITNDLRNAYELSGKSNIKLIVSGGTCRENSYSLIGSLVTDNLLNFNVTKAFIGCSSFDIKRGITTPIIDEGVTAKLMIKNSSRTFVLADSSKYGKEALFQTAMLSEVDYIITDDGFPEEEAKKIKTVGVNLITVKYHK